MIGSEFHNSRLRSPRLGGESSDSPSGSTYEQRTYMFSEVNPDSGTTPTIVGVGGKAVGLNPSSDNTAVLLVSMDGGGTFKRITPGQAIASPDHFDRLFIKRPAALASSNLNYFIDVAPDIKFLPYVTSPQINVIQGAPAALANAWPVKITDATNGPAAVKAGAVAAVIADPSLVVALSPNTPLPAGTAVIGNVNLITGQTGITGAAGTIGASTPRVTIATNDGVRTDLDTLAGVVTAARAAVNPIAGQAGVDANRGVATALTQRVTIATDDAITAASTIVGSLATGDTLVEIPDTATNGVTFVSLIAANATKAHVPTTITLSNEDTIAHVFLLLRGGGAGTVIQRWSVPAGGSFTYDGRGDVRTGTNESLGIKLVEAIGTIQPHVSGAAVTR